MRILKKQSVPSTDLILLSAITLWGLNYSVIKFGLSQLEPLVFPVFRFAIGGLVLFAILRITEGSVRIRREDLPLLGVISFLGVTVTQITFVFALANTGAADTALLQATGPIATVVLVTVAGLERFGKQQWIAVAVGLGGVALIVVGGSATKPLSENLLGDCLVLVNVVASSASTIPILPLLRRYTSQRILTYEMFIGTLLLLPLAVPSLLTQDYRRVTLAGWAALGYAIIFTGILTNLLYFAGIGRIGPSRAAMYQYLQSFLGIVFAVILLGEHVTILQLVGGAIVMGSIALSRTGPHTLGGAFAMSEGGVVSSADLPHAMRSPKTTGDIPSKGEV